MPLPLRAADVTRHLNPLMLRLAGIGPLVVLEHRGRRTGRLRRTPILAFRDGDLVTVALTYGPDVQWLANVRAAQSARMRMGKDWLELGRVRRVSEGAGMSRMPWYVRPVLRVIRCRDFVEFPVAAAGDAP